MCYSILVESLNSKELSEEEDYITVDVEDKDELYAIVINYMIYTVGVAFITIKNHNLTFTDDTEEFEGYNVFDYDDTRDLWKNLEEELELTNFEEHQINMNC